MLQGEINMEKFNYNNINSIQGNDIKIIDEENNKHKLNVAEVCTSEHHSDDCQCFYVILKSEEKNQFPQGTYRFEHEAFGEMTLFMSPNGEQEYEIVVNQFKPN